MSIGPFDPTAGNYGSLNYVDPFGDTTADIGKSVAPSEPKTIMPVPQRPVSEKSTIPAKVSGGNVGISPITTQGAVSIPVEPTAPNQAYLDAMARKDDIAQYISGISSSLVFPQPYVDPRTPEEKEAAFEAFEQQNNYQTLQVAPELEAMTGSELEALYRQQEASYTLVNGIDWGFGGGANYKTADTGYSSPEIAVAWNKKMIEEGRLQPKTDRTGQYSAIPSTKLPSEGFGGLQGHAFGSAPVFLLNSENPEEGGIEAARAELLDYIDNNSLGDGDVAGYDYNLNIVSNAIGGKYGVLGSDWAKTSDILPQGGNTETRIQRVVDAFDGVSSTAEGIKNYTGKEDYTPAEYTDGLFGKANKYTNMSDAEFNEFYSLIKPIADDYMFATAVSGNGLTQAREQFLNDPMIASLMNEYGMKQTRSTSDGSLYTWDPFTNREIRLKEEKYNLGRDVVQGLLTVGTIAVTAGNPAAAAAVSGARAAQQGGDLGDVAKASIGAYLGSEAAGGQGMFSAVGNSVAPAGSALAKGISAGAASGVATAVQGGDLDDVVKSGLLGGVGGYLQANAAEAAMLQDATNAALEIGDSATALQYADEARKLTAQADLVSTIANSAKAVDAAVSGDYVSALASGMQAAGTNLTEFTSNQLTGMFGEEAFANLNIDDVAAGVNKVATSLAEGKDIEEALQKGVTTYIQQGGSLGEAGDQVRDYLESAGGSLYENVIKPAGDMLSGLVDNVSSFDTPEGIKAIEDAVRAAGVAVDDTVLQAVKEGAEDIYEPLETPEAVKAIEDVAKVAGSAAEDVVRDTGSAIDDAILQPVKDVVETAYEAIPTPDVDLPSVSAPNINIDLGGMFDSLMAYLPSQQQQRRAVVPQQTTAPVLADLSDLYLQQAEPEELLATRDYLSGLLRTI